MNLPVIRNLKIQTKRVQIMPENSSLNMYYFREMTYREFDTLKTWKTARNIEQKLTGNNRSNTFWGCLALPFIKLGVRVGEKAYLQQSERYNYSENEERAKKLLNHFEIRKILCCAMHEVGSKEILTEEKMVNTVVNSLGKEKIREKFSISLDKILFAYLCYELLQIGLENYCEVDIEQ